MPFVNIRITKENGEPTTKQKEELIAGVTELLARVLNEIKSQTSSTWISTSWPHSQERMMPSMMAWL